MVPYRDLAGDSGVIAYALDPHGIRVRFRNGSTYRYDETRPGAVHVAQMKRLAIAGRGLSTYISQYVASYAEKLDD